jgi:hypothetical protein
VTKGHSILWEFDSELAGIRRFVLLSFREAPMIAGRPTMLADYRLGYGILFAANGVRASYRIQRSREHDR